MKWRSIFAVSLVTTLMLLSAVMAVGQNHLPLYAPHGLGTEPASI